MNEDFIEIRETRFCEISGKRCYNEREAGNILNSLKHHRNSDHLGRNKDLPRRKYYCTDCGCYHLTKQPLYDKDSLHYAWEDRFYSEYEERTSSNKKARKYA